MPRAPFRACSRGVSAQPFEWRATQTKIMSTVLHANCDTACVTRREAPAAHPKLVLATKGGAAIWWTEARNAGWLLCAAKDGDIPKAAALLGIVATDHATVLARAGAALARLDARLLASAPRRRPRIPQSRIPAASLAGPSRRPTLPAVLGRKGARLQRALVAVAAVDRPGIVARVFGGEGPLPPVTSLMSAPKYNMQYPGQRNILPNTGGELRGVRPWTG